MATGCNALPQQELKGKPTTDKAGAKGGTLASSTNFHSISPSVPQVRTRASGKSRGCAVCDGEVDVVLAEGLVPKRLRLVLVGLQAGCPVSCFSGVVCPSGSSGSGSARLGGLHRA